MITTPTVFIVGAGASVPYGFPSGNELLALLKTDGNFHNLLGPASDAARLGKLIVDFQKQLRFADPSSIDEFLELKPHLRVLGKRLIAASLVPREEPGVLIDAHRKGHWLRHLWHAIKCPPDDFRGNRIAFIIYNYDRCIEHYLTNAMSALYGIDQMAAWQVLSQVPFIHPHGLLGEYLPDETAGNGGSFRPFTKQCGVDVILCASSSLSLYWENTPAQISRREQMAHAIAQAKRIIFLGFGFLDINVAHLTSSFQGNGGAQYFATTYGMPKVETRSLSRRINQSLKQLDGDCLQLFQDVVDLKA